MSTSYDLGPVEKLTAGAVGEPGNRVFYIQARSGDVLVTLLAEKEQVQALGESLQQLLAQVPDLPVDDVAGESLELEEPLLPEWRVGAMSIAYDDAADRIALSIEEFQPEDEPGEPATARMLVTRGQIAALAEHALDIVAQGRPRCQLCGFPIEPEGHACPAQNGHKELGG